MHSKTHISTKLICPIIISLATFSKSVAQAPSLSFSRPSAVCIGGNRTFTATSSNVTNLSWDFCNADVASAPTGSLLTPNYVTGSQGNNLSYAQVFDGTNWYGFAVVNPGSTLQRIEYGPNLENLSPDVYDLGNPGGALSTTYDLKILKWNGNWYGVAANFGSNNVILMSFGPSLTVTPTTTVAFTMTSIASLDWGNDAGVFTVVAVGTNNSMVVARFTNGITSAPTISNYASSFGSAWGIVLRQEIQNGLNNGNWVAFVTGNSTLTRVNFGSSLSSVPTFTNLSNPGSLLSLLPRADLVYDAGYWYLVLVNVTAASQGNFARIRIGTNLTSTSFVTTAFGTLGIAVEAYGASGAFVNGKYLLTIAAGFGGTQRLQRLTFANPCSNTPSFSSGVNTPAITFGQTGTYYISLRGFDTNYKPISYSDTIVVNANPMAKIGLNNPFVCQNAVTQFFDSTGSGAGPVATRNWDFGFGGGTSTQANPTFTYPNRGSYTVTLNVTTQSGCSNTTQRNVVIAGRPTASFTVPTTCAGRSVQFNNSTTTTGNTTYLWRFGNGVTSAQTNPSYVYPIGGTYTATLICTSDSGCVDSTSRTVQVPSLDFGTTSTCPGVPVTFTLRSSYPGATVNSVVWTFQGPGLNTTSTQSNPVITFNNLGNYTAKLRVSTSSGCVDSITKTLQILAVPSVSIQRLDSACTGNTIRFSAGINSQSNPVVFTRWDFGDPSTLADTSLAGTGSYLYANAGTYTVTLTVRLQSGCVITRTRSIVVYALPTSNFALPTVVCTNTAFVLSPAGSVPTTGDPLNAFSWELPGGFTSTLRTPVFTPTQGGNASVALTVISAAGCTNRRSVNLTIQQRPVASFSIPNNRGPIPFSVPVTNGSTGATQFRWTCTNGQSFNTANPTFNFTQARTDTVTLISTSATGCSDTVRRVVTSFQPVLDVQVLDASRDVGGQNNLISIRFTVQNNSNVTLTSFTARGEINGASAIIENFSTNLAPGANADFSFRSTLLIPTGLGQNFVCVRASNPNGGTDATPADNQFCRNLIEGFSVVRFYPNPASDVLSVDLSLPSAGGINIQVIDHMGRQLSQQVISGTAGLNVFQLPLGGISVGLYRLSIQFGGSRKFVTFIRN